MNKKIPEMLESFSQLVATPLVSSTDPQWDQSNGAVVNLMELEETRRELRNLISETIGGSGLGVEYHSIFDGIPGFQTDINSEVIQVAEKSSGRESGTVAFGTEGPYFNAMGMDTVVPGPGDIEQAHKANEYLSLDRIPPMLDILTRMVDHFCIRS